MANSSNDHWHFTKEQLENSPSKQCGVEPYKELSYRQQAANFIQDMGQKLKVSQLCINTAIVYMHRFYVFHSFTRFPWNSIAAAALFLAAKVEEQPRKLEHVIRVVTPPKNPHDTSIDTTSERYIAQAQDIVFNENILLQTLGFDVAIDHPHTHVVRCCHLVRASKDLAQTSYFMASNSLHLTTMCLQYKPTVVACFCIHFVCKWSNWEIPLSNEKKEWFSYVDETVTSELLEQLTKEFLFIYDRCSSRLKEKIMAIGDGLALSHNSSHSSSPFEPDKKFFTFPSSDQKDGHGHRSHHNDNKLFTIEDFKQRPLRLPHEPGSSGQHRDREREYREKKDRERLGHHIKPPLPNMPSNKHAPPQHGHHSNHGTPIDPKLNKHPRPPSIGHSSNTRMEPRDILKDSIRDVSLRDCKESNKDIVSKDSLPNRENNQARVASDKRDYMHQRLEIKPSSVSESNSLTNINYSGDKRVDVNRPRPSIDPKLQQRRREENKLHIKVESDTKKHSSVGNHGGNDKNAFLHKSVSSTSQKVKSPFSSEMPKSVPNQNMNQFSSTTTSKPEIKIETHNGNSGSAFNLPLIENDVKTKLDPILQEEPTMVPVNPVKKPSLFSPEKSPPLQKKPRMKSSPNSDLKPEKIAIQGSIAKELKPPDLIPPFSSSNGSNVPLSQPIVNGIETNPSLISSLLKETPSIPHLPAVAATTTVTVESKEKVHHKEHKKNKKEKHKHKDKEKNREEKEKKKKHKDKDRDKHKHKHEKHQTENEDVPAQPIKITIPKDKIQPSENSTPSLGLKIKIPKDRIKTDGIGESSAIGGGLKIKISKEVINNFSGNDNNKKREREKNSPSTGPPNKVLKSNHNRVSEAKSTKNCYNKVSNLNNNVGDATIHNMQTSMYNGVNHMTHSGYVNQNAPHNYFYNYPPPNMQLPMVPTNLNVPPPYMYQQYYAPGYLYPSADMYATSNMSLGNEAPPLPHEPPPNNPPPPPPDF